MRRTLQRLLARQEQMMAEMKVNQQKIDANIDASEERL
jgi:hypothetical protein